MITRTTFPPGFLWGVATGAHQTEGGNVTSDWWVRETMPGSPVAERCGDAVDSYHRWPEDLDLVAGAGFTDYRFGIEWARIEPADGVVSRAQVDHYRRIVEGARERGLRPLATLHHFTLPQWFAAGGGWLRGDAAERFLRYVDALGPVLDAGVERVETINEPNIVAAFPRLRAGTGFAGGLPVPDEQISDALIAVHAATVDRLHARHPGLLVGWGVSVQDIVPEPGVSRALLREYCGPRDEDFLRAAATDDWVGVQVYTRLRLGPDGNPLPPPADAELTQTGWEVRPDAVGGAVRRTAEVVGATPIVVSEFGIATTDDEQRIRFTADALASLRAAMDDGADVRGAFHWSLLDNWEWGHWAPTFGLVAVDRTDFRRIPKPSLGRLGALAPAGGHR